MKVINNLKEREIIIITYFKLLNEEYILYTDNDELNEKNIYLANVISDDKKIKLVSPKINNMPILNELINNFLKNENDEELLINNDYKYIDIDILNDKKVEEINYLKIVISKEKYIKLLLNKYLTYPELKILNEEEIEKEGYDKNNQKFIPYSLLSIVIYYLFFLLVYLIFPKPLNNLFSLNGITIVMWSLVILLISMSAYNFEDREFKESFTVVFSIILIFLISLMMIESKFNIFNYIIVSFIYSIIFTIPYSVSKKIAFYFINKNKCRNYITYYCIYLIPFFMIILTLINIYNKFLYNFAHIQF